MASSTQKWPVCSAIQILIYSDVRAAVTWLGGDFGFRERVRIGESHCAQLCTGADGAVIVAEDHGEQFPPDTGRVTHIIRVRVEDVEAHHSHARNCGARVLNGSIDREYGERDFTVEDLGGLCWNISEPVHEVAPEEFGCETAEVRLHPA